MGIGYTIAFLLEWDVLGISVTSTMEEHCIYHGWQKQIKHVIME